MKNLLLGMLGQVKLVRDAIRLHLLELGGASNNPHGSQSSYVGGEYKIIKRDAAGRAQVTAGVSANDIAVVSQLGPGGGGGSVTAITAGAGLRVSVGSNPISTTGTLALDNALTSPPGTYKYAIMTVQPDGRVTAIGDGDPVTAITVTAPLAKTQPSGIVALSITAATPSAPGSMSAADKTLLNAATAAATVNTLAKRDAAAQITVADIPTATGHAASKGYVDSGFVGMNFGHAAAKLRTASFTFPSPMSGTAQLITFTGTVTGTGPGTGNAPTTSAGSGTITPTATGLYSITFSFGLLDVIGNTPNLGIGTYANGVLITDTEYRTGPNGASPGQLWSGGFTTVALCVSGEVLTLRARLLSGGSTQPVFSNLVFAIHRVA